MIEIPIHVRFSGPHKRSREIKRRLFANAPRGSLRGYCESHHGKGISVWVDSRQNDRELVDSFFHEMVHAFLQIGATHGRFTLSNARAESLAFALGYSARIHFGDLLPKTFGRKT